MHPTVSVVVAVGAGDLGATIATLDAQVYDRVEVLVAADRPLEAAGAARVAVAEGAREHQVNQAAASAAGEFVLVLDAGDLLEPHAVCDLVEALQGGADGAYGDEDRIDEHGESVWWHLKPAALGPETLLSYDVVGAPLLVRRELWESLGGLDASCAPVAAHDFALRLCARAASLVHVGEVLLSRPETLDADPADAAAATVPVVARALHGLGVAATVAPGDVLPSARFTLAAPTPAPSVAIVIPTRDRLDLLAACVASVERRTTYANYSIVICDNDSASPETHAWLASTPHAVVPCPGPFNYAKIVNRGVAHTDADFVVTLNNDTTVATPDWLERLVGLCSMPGVASVGVKLVFPDGRLQHEGVGIMPLPVHVSRDTNYPRRDRWLTSTRNASAVTGACQIVRSDAWRELGGLDEDLAVGYNDVDFGLRLCAAGWRVVYTPEVVLGHRESATRGNLHPLEDVHRLIARWDLLGGFQDPAVPAAMRFVTSAISLVPPSGPPIAPPPRGPLLPCSEAQGGVDLASLRAQHAELVGALGAAPSTGRSALVARWVGREARAILDDGAASDAFRTVAPDGTRRRVALRAAAQRAVLARRGGGAPVTAAVRRYRHFEARTRPSPDALRARVGSLGSLEVHPVVTVVVDAEGDGLAETLASIEAQCYDRVETLLVVRDGDAGLAGARGIVHDGVHADRMNAAVSEAGGEFVVVLEAGDLLAPHAIVDLVGAVQHGAVAAYGDEDRHDERGERVAWHL